MWRSTGSRSRRGRTQPSDGARPITSVGQEDGQDSPVSGGRVTSLAPSRKAADRMHLSVDGQYICTLSDLAVYEAKLHVGMVLDEETIARLRSQATVQSHTDAALNFLSFRPRSEREMRRYLSQRGMGPEEADSMIAEFKRLDLINDEAFARFWTENRRRFRPRGDRLLTAELMQKGVDRETIDTVTSGDDAPDQEALALDAARPFLRRVEHLEWREFRERLGNHLVRRGFDYNVASSVCKLLWADRTTDGDSVDTA